MKPWALKPWVFWAVVTVVVLFTVLFCSPLSLPHFKVIAAAITVCMHFYFLQELERQEQGQSKGELLLD